jgi:hypothetical protein
MYVLTILCSGSIMAAELDLKAVLISDEVDEQCIEILRRNGIEAIKQTKLSKDQLKAELPVSFKELSHVNTHFY